MQNRILIIGACGQIGTELTVALRAQHGAHNVIASDIVEGDKDMMEAGPFEVLDAMDALAIEKLCAQYYVGTVYLMAAMLSATAEKYPERAWELNMESLFNVLNLARDGKINKVFWPSSIAVFGPSTPRNNTPQQTIMEPTTVYGISKQTGERWCEYYNKRYGVDVRSIRYPGLISWKAQPGGGTTDYAVAIFHEALEQGTYDCFLKEDTGLPMMYMDDAIRATIELMDADTDRVQVRSAYNLGGISFTPAELVSKIKEQLPDFTVQYNPDFRQAIADSWPASIDDSVAQQHWGWKHDYDLEQTVVTMLTNLKAQHSNR